MIGILKIITLEATFIKADASRQFGGFYYQFDHNSVRIYTWPLLFPDAVGLSRAIYGQGMGQIVMDDVSCTGMERRLIDCQHTTNHNCAHHEDASVRCNTSKLDFIFSAVSVVKYLQLLKSPIMLF